MATFPHGAAALTALIAFTPASAMAQSFSDEPISCGFGSQYKGCTAAFDGRTLRITYIHPEGKHSVATYVKCVATMAEIHCIDGEWRSAIGSGSLGSRSIGLREGKPFPQ